MDEGNDHHARMNKLLVGLLTAAVAGAVSFAVAWVKDLRSDLSELQRITMDRSRLVGEYQTRMAAVEARCRRLEEHVERLGR